ncbi:MAG: bacteriohemerythrin [Gammaproteobacteria bacterium]
MAPLIEWMDEFELGIDEVDADHRALIELINGLTDALNTDSGDDDIKHLLTEIHTRIGDHFGEEERIMRETGYAAYDAHKADHERLLGDILNMIDDYREVYALAPDLLGIRIENWFMVHFRTHDARLHGIAG